VARFVLSIITHFGILNFLQILGFFYVF